MGPGDCQDKPYTEDWVKTGVIREAGDWARETARTGPILKIGERLMK